MGDEFREEQHERQERKSQLQQFRAAFRCSEWLLAPRRGGAFAKTANLPEHRQIDDRTKERNKHHRDSNGIGV